MRKFYVYTTPKGHSVEYKVKKMNAIEAGIEKLLRALLSEEDEHKTDSELKTMRIKNERLEQICKRQEVLLEEQSGLISELLGAMGK